VTNEQRQTGESAATIAGRPEKKSPTQSAGAWRPQIFDRAINATMGATAKMGDVYESDVHDEDIKRPPAHESGTLEHLVNPDRIGAVDANFQSGNTYYWSVGHGKADLETAATWYKKAAEAGDSRAMLMYANCLHGGFGCRRNIVAAISWYLKGAELGNASAMYMCGLGFQYGWEAAFDESRAAVWYWKAADSGNDIGAVAMRGMMA
jgi:hypothetical protein